MMRHQLEGGTDHDVHEIIHDWADTNSADHMSYDQAVALVSSKGHTLETLHACLEE